MAEERQRLTRRSVERLERAIGKIGDRSEVYVELDDQFLTIAAPRSLQRWQIPVRPPIDERRP